MFTQHANKLQNQGIELRKGVQLLVEGLKYISGCVVIHYGSLWRDDQHILT